MCKLIAELTGADPETLRETINSLELASGAPGIDIRLTSEIYGKIHMKMRELGLDPQDTTSAELYYALLSLTALHDGFLKRRFGIKANAGVEHILAGVVETVNHLKLPRQTWAIKHVAAKRLLKATPPKNLMKLLHYRSIASLLKRESPAAVLTAAHHYESSAWQGRMLQAYKKLQPGDFETRPIEVAYLNQPRWQSLSKTQALHGQTAVLHSVEAGYIAVLPVIKANPNGLTLVSMLSILHYINEIRSYASLLKFHHMHADFGTFLMETVRPDSTGFSLQLGRQPIQWRVVHQYYGQNLSAVHPEIFEPHVQPEDLSYRKAEAVLYRLEPALHFWHGNDYVGLAQADGPVSFNLSDMALNLLNNAPYEQRKYYHLRDSLWNELYLRYLDCPSLELQILRQLDERVAPDALPAFELEFAW